MPIWLRKFTYHLIEEFIKQKNPQTSAEDTWISGTPNTQVKTIDPKQYAGFQYASPAGKK